MTNDRKRDQWLQDVEARQRNIVFPNTVENEARFWRNLGTQRSNTSTKVGLGILGVFVYAGLITIFVAAFREGVAWRLAVGMILFCGATVRCYRLGHPSKSPKYREGETISSQS
jgi:hypothetical protein